MFFTFFFHRLFFFAQMRILIYGFEIRQPTNRMPIKSTIYMRITYAFINQAYGLSFSFNVCNQVGFFNFVIFHRSLSRYDRNVIQFLSSLFHSQTWIPSQLWFHNAYSYSYLWKKQDSERRRREELMDNSWNAVERKPEDIAGSPCSSFHYNFSAELIVKFR